MAKIIAKSKSKQEAGEVRLEGKTDDAAVLVVEVILQLGAQIRATLADAGVTNVEPEGEPPNDFALGMANMVRAVKQRARDEEEAGHAHPPE